MDRRDLRARLDLERSDRFAAGDQVVGLLIVGRDRVHLRPRARARLDRIKGTFDHREPAKTEKVELRHVDVVEIVLVELQDRTTHRRLLDWQVVAERRSGEDKASDMSRPEAGDAFKRTDRLEQHLLAIAGDVETNALRDVFANRL